jgi:sec-independent protein translocase protein TatC
MADKTQPLLEHLIELRNRLVKCVIVFTMATGICYFFASDIYGLLTEPLAKIQAETPRRLIYTGLTEAFVTYLKVALFAGGFLTVPFLLTQIWLFLVPGLYAGERRTVLPFFIAAPILFLLGAALAFWGVIPIAWKFFLSFETPQPSNGLPIILEARVGEYLSLTMAMIFAFGLAFQMPIALGLMGKLGIIKAEALVKYRKWAVVLILAASAVLTPSTDIISQAALAIPLYCLYEISIGLVKWLQRKSLEENYA